MRHVAEASGRFTRCSIAEGELADITGCYPDEVIRAKGIENRTIPLGMGRMTIFPVMGTALIRSHRISKARARGPLLLMDLAACRRIPDGTSWEPIPDSSLASIDWVHVRSDTLYAIQQKASLATPSDGDMEGLLRRYCTEQGVPSDWADNVRSLLRVP
jgi:hypothetical protein